MATSLGPTTPRSPCRLSIGCSQVAGVPVEVSVAAIFRAMSPDLPMPDDDDAARAMLEQLDRRERTVIRAHRRGPERVGLEAEHPAACRDQTLRVHGAVSPRSRR